MRDSKQSLSQFLRRITMIDQSVEGCNEHYLPLEWVEKIFKADGAIQATGGRENGQGRERSQRKRRGVPAPTSGSAPQVGS